MSWTDEEIDKLAREGAANSSVEYKNEYWAEFEAMLPASGKKDFLWFFTAFLFIGLMGTSFVFNGINDDKKVQSARQTENIEKSIETKMLNTNGENQSMTEVTTDSRDASAFDQNQGLNAPVKNFKSSESNKNSDQAYSNSQKNNLTNRTSASTGIQASTNNSKTSESPIQPKRNLPNEVLVSERSNTKNDLEENSMSKASETTISPLPILGVNEFVTNASLSPGIEFSKQKMPAQATFYVNGFGGLSQSLITPSKDISTSFGLGLGVQVQKGKFTFTTGVNGVWSNHKDLNLSRSAKVYGFGSSEYNYRFQYKQIYSLEMELTAGYKMGRHLVNVGIRPSFVIGTKVGVVETVNDEKTIDRIEYGYVDGLNRFGIKPTIGYSYDITPSFKVGMNVGVELMSKIREGYLEGISNHFPIDGQLYLRKSIRFKR